MSGVVLATFGVGVVGGLVPFVNVEAWVIGVSAACPGASAVPVAVAAALGQVTAKAVLYRAGEAALRARDRGARLEGALRRLAAGPGRSRALVFASALTGVPPFALVSVAAGAVRFPFASFVTLALVGRLLRFAAVFALARVGR